MLARELSMTPADVGRLRPSVVRAYAAEILAQRKSERILNVESWMPVLTAFAKVL